MENEFSVWLFFPDGSSHAEARWISAEEAVNLAKRCTERPAAQIGIIRRIIITDGGDFCCFEWKKKSSPSTSATYTTAA